MTIRARLIDVFTRALDLPAGAAVEPMSYNESPGWDSVGHMRLVAALETEFDVMLATMQILDLSSFAQGLAILQAHGVHD